MVAISNSVSAIGASKVGLELDRAWGVVVASKGCVDVDTYLRSALVVVSMNSNTRSVLRQP